MSTDAAPRVRRSLTDPQAAYESRDRQPLEDLMRSWKSIKELPPDDPRSSFALGGYHGEPFRGAQQPANRPGSQGPVGPTGLVQ